MSEGEADGDLEGLAGRVAQLEELLQGKEAIVEALNAEIDHLRAEASSPNSSQSQNSSVHSKDVISLYHTKVCVYFYFWTQYMQIVICFVSLNSYKNLRKQ